MDLVNTYRKINRRVYILEFRSDEHFVYFHFKRVSARIMNKLVFIFTSIK